MRLEEISEMTTEAFTPGNPAPAGSSDLLTSGANAGSLLGAGARSPKLLEATLLEATTPAEAMVLAQSIDFENHRHADLVKAAWINRPFHDAFVAFLLRRGYACLGDFVFEADPIKGYRTLLAWFGDGGVTKRFHDGAGQAYPPAKGRWLYCAWIFRDNCTQRLDPLRKQLPGFGVDETRAIALNEARRSVMKTLTAPGAWEWDAIAEVLVDRLEGSRRAIMGNALEGVIRQAIVERAAILGVELAVHPCPLHLAGETYDICVDGVAGRLVMPVKSRESIGSGHANLYKRDIDGPILAARAARCHAVPVMVGEGWPDHLIEALPCPDRIVVRINPRRRAEVADALRLEIAARDDLWLWLAGRTGGVRPSMP